MKHCITLFIILITTAFKSYAQLYVSAPLHIDSGATITVTNMNVTTNNNITGKGTLQLKNNINTNLSCNNNQIPNLLIDCATPNRVELQSNVIINGTLQFNNGSINTNNSDLILNDNATTSGASSNNYIVCNGTGKVVKNVAANITNFQLPIGTTTNYQPVSFTTTGTYTAGANISSRAVNAVHPNKLASLTDYLNVYWPCTRNGITGTVNVIGGYTDATNIVGTESKIKGAMYTPTGWQNDGSANNYTTNLNEASLTTATADLYGSNTFAQLNAKVFLQGAYNSSTLKLNDALRTPTNLIPLSDPYRVAPYDAAFTHINNTEVEVANANVFANQSNADNNIVDWVFVEVRNSAIGTPGSNKVKTRSALLQKDGDVVDVDGVSPLVLKDIKPGQYTIAIRHRNHLGICTDPLTNLQTLDMRTPLTITDFTTFTDAQIFGKADSNYKVIGLKNALYAGNANSNNRVSFIGLNSDKDKIFGTLGNVSSNTSVSNVYDPSDINMNRNVRYINLNSDKDFLFGILGNNSATVKNQALPQ